MLDLNVRQEQPALGTYKIDDSSLSVDYDLICDLNDGVYKLQNLILKQKQVIYSSSKVKIFQLNILKIRKKVKCKNDCQLILGQGLDGKKEVLGIYLAETERLGVF